MHNNTNNFYYQPSQEVQSDDAWSWVRQAAMPDSSQSSAQPEPSTHDNTFTSAVDSIAGSFSFDQGGFNPWGNTGNFGQTPYPYANYDADYAAQEQAQASSSHAPENNAESHAEVDEPSEANASNNHAEDSELNKMMSDWNGIQSAVFQSAASDTEVNNAIENLFSVYVHSPVFKGMICKLKDSGQTISVRSGTGVSHGKYFPKKSRIVLNTSAITEPGKLLAVLALHLTHASYLSHPSASGQPAGHYKEQCFSRMKLYYEQAGSVLEDMGLGKASDWIKSSRQEPQNDEEQEASASTTVEPDVHTATEAHVSQPQSNTTHKTGWAQFGKKITRSWNKWTH